MKRKLWLGLCAIFVLAAAFYISPKHVSASVQDFTIPSFTADYHLSRNDSKTSILKTTETIQVEFPETDQNHGIERAIPSKYQGHSVNLQIGAVTDNAGRAYNYTTRQQNNNTILRIGDANTFVHGPMVYKISYSQKNVINFQNNDEFYWDVNGDQWPQAMGQVTSRVYLDRQLSDALNGEKICFNGPIGSKQQNCTISAGESPQETVITSQAFNVQPNQTLTFDIAFKKDTFIQGPEVANEKRTLILVLVGSLAIIILLPVLTFAILYPKWRAAGKDPKGRGVIIPEYIAPKGLNVINSSYVLNQNVSSQAISAGIIELAVQGYIQISEIEKSGFLSKSTDYQLKIVKDTHTLAKEQKDVLEALFDKTSTGTTTLISTKKNKLYGTIKNLNTYLAENLTTNGYFATNPQKARSRFLIPAVLTLVSAFILFFLIPLGIGLLLSGVVMFVFSNLMPARSPKGVETRDYLLGLKSYIDLAEADRLKYLQSPEGVEKTPISTDDPTQLIKLFENLLPYAILFGLEKEWAKQFKDLYKQPPEWYSGNTSTFNAIYLANALHGFSVANSATFSAPSSSGSSGFGGGGFSGGGGGGGGGGGW